MSVIITTSVLDYENQFGVHVITLLCSICSVFALATPEELAESLKRWREKVNDGSADQCLQESEELRKTVGLNTSVIAYKV